MDTRQDLSGSVVAVSGASRGLGLTAAKAFVNAGAQVAMMARNRARLEQEAADIGAAALPIVTDVADPESVRAAFRRIREHFGGLNVLVNNAGVAVLRSIEDATDEQIFACVGTNLLGPVYATRAAIPLFRESGGGHIINVSSESTLFPTTPLLSLYVATKTGMDAFSKAAFAELKPLGVRVTVLTCGSIADTGFGGDWDVADAQKFFTAIYKSGHLAAYAPGLALEPGQVAEVMLNLVRSPANVAMDVVQVRPYEAASVEAVTERATTLLKGLGLMA